MPVGASYTEDTHPPSSSSFSSFPSPPPPAKFQFLYPELTSCGQHNDMTIAPTCNSLRLVYSCNVFRYRSGLIESFRHMNNDIAKIEGHMPGFSSLGNTGKCVVVVEMSVRKHTNYY